MNHTDVFIHVLVIAQFLCNSVSVSDILLPQKQTIVTYGNEHRT